MIFSVYWLQVGLNSFSCIFLSCHVHVSEWMNVKEPLAQNRHGIWSLGDCNRTQVHNHLVCKWTLNHLATLVRLNGWVFVYEVSGCGFKSRCSLLNFLNIYQASKFQVFTKINGSFPYSFEVSNLHLETDGSWFESNF